MNRKLIFLDVDGTLTVTGGNKVPESAVRAIRQAQKNGHLVFVCSGRCYSELQEVLKIGFDGFVSSAGGYVAADGQVLYDCPMTEEQTRTAVRVFDACGATYNMESLDKTFCCGENPETRMHRCGKGVITEERIQSWLKALTEFGILPQEPYDGRPVYKMYYYVDREEMLADAKAALEADFEFCRAQPRFGSAEGEIINRAFNKGDGVRRIAEHYGADLADTIAFGDSMNDASAAGVAGLCVCMGGGDPKFAAMCDLLADSPENDGIAKMFAKLELV